MSILDVFTIVFDGDSSGAKKASDDTKKYVSEVEDQTKKSEEANVKLGESFLTVGKTVAGLAAGFLTFDAFKTSTVNAIKYNAELDKTSKFLGLNITDLGAWKGAMDAAGYSGDSVVGTMQSMVSQFEQMGRPDLARRVPEILKNLASSAKDFPRDVFLTQGRMFGIDEQTLAFMLEYGSSIDNVLQKAKDLNTVQDESGENARKLERAWNELSESGRRFGTSLQDGLTPALLLGANLFGEIISKAESFFSLLSSYGESAVDRSWGQIGMDFLTGDWLDVARRKGASASPNTSTTAGIFLGDNSDLLAISESQLYRASTANVSSAPPSLGNRNVTVSTGDITINTQATNAEGIASEVGRELERQMRYTVDNFTDGEAY